MWPFSQHHETPEASSQERAAPAEGYEEAIIYAQKFTEGAELDASAALEILKRNHKMMSEKKATAEKLNAKTQKLLEEEIVKAEKHILALGGTVEKPLAH